MQLSYKFPKIIATALFFIFVAVYFHQPIETEDIWWHLKMGEYIAQNKQVPIYDPLPYTTEITPFVHTQWGGSLFYYAVYKLAGLEGLRITRVLLGLLVFSIFLIYSSRRIPFVLAFLLAFVIFYPVEGRSFLRPDFFNFIFIQIFLIALFAHRDSKSWKPLLAIPAAGIFWSNIHLGSFMYGVLILGTFLFHYFIQYIQAAKQNFLKESAGHLRRFEQLGTVTFIYLFLFLLNPYGIEGFLFPFKVLFIKDYLEFDYVSRTISELMPPIYILNRFYFWFYLLFGAVLACLAKFKTDRFLYTILFALVTYLFLHSMRAGALFGLVCGYIITDLLGREQFSLQWRSWKFSRTAEQILLSAAAVLLLILITRGINTKVYLNGKTYRYYIDLVKNQSNPSAALKVLTDNKINGLVFNSMSYGGYMFWHTYPALKPFTDSRFSDLPAFFAYMAVQRNPEKAWPIFESLYPADIVLLLSNRPLSMKSVHYFMNHPDWRLIFVEGDSLLFVKKDKFSLPDDLLNFRENLEAKNPLFNEISARIPEYPFRESTLLRLKKMIFPSYYYVDLETTAVNLFNLGFSGAALETMAEALKINDDILLQDTLQQMRHRFKEKSR